MPDHYADYSADDFLQDPYFYKWVRFPTAEHEAFWQSWLIQHPEKRAVVEHARHLIQSIIDSEERPPSHFKAEDWKSIQHRIALSEAPRAAPTQPNHSSVRPFKVWAVAASVILALSTGVILYLNSFSPPDWIALQTYYGEQQSITLPDGSEVILNGNSTLRYSADWNTQADSREVWLEGEGFFSVTKQPTEVASSTKGFTKFTVHAGGLNEEVRGTQFYVQSRPKKTRVVLSEGEVLVRSQQQDSILLQPNELAESTSGGSGIRKKVVDANSYISWKDHILTFDEESISSILNHLENTYGWQIDIQDSSWLQQKYTGSIPTDRIELLFEKFALLYELNIEQDSQHVTIRPLNQ